jgi:glycosyltransferase involved in cell wall biosynthesis
MSGMHNKTLGVLSWDYGRPKGGMGRSLQTIAAALQRGGFSLRVIATCAGDAPDDPFLRITRHIGGQVLFSLLLPFTLNRRLRRTKQGEQAADQLLLPVGPGGVLLLRRLPVPVTAIVYHSYAQQAALVPGQWWKKIFCPFEKRTLRFCTHILCFSDDTRRALIGAYGIENARITVLPHPVAVSETSSVERDPLLCLCVARLDQRKGVGDLLRAWPSIHSQHPQARLVLVGDGSQRRMIDRLIARTTNVERRSTVTQQELDTLLARAQVAFCPAYLEGFGLACAEAMAAGCCVIASDADGLRQLVVQGESGVLVPAGDCDALAAAAVGVLSDPEQAHRLGKAAVARIRSVCDVVTAERKLCDAVRSRFA